MTEDLWKDHTREQLIYCLERGSKEIEYWRNFFLKERHIEDSGILSHFSFIPSELMIQKSPQEHLIECLNCKLYYQKEK